MVTCDQVALALALATLSRSGFASPRVRSVAQLAASGCKALAWTPDRLTGDRI